jgi:hypothetical protein
VVAPVGYSILETGSDKPSKNPSTGLHPRLKEIRAIFSLTGGDKKSHKTSRVRARVAHSRMTDKEFAHSVDRKHFLGHSCTSSYFKVIEILFTKVPPIFFVSARISVQVVD